MNLVPRPLLEVCLKEIPNLTSLEARNDADGSFSLEQVSTYGIPQNKWYYLSWGIMSMIDMLIGKKKYNHNIFLPTFYD